MPSPFTYGDSYGQIEGLNLSKDSARDSRYFNSLSAIRQAQQDAFNNQLQMSQLGQRADENAYNRDYQRQFDLSNLGLRRQGAALDQAKFDWQRTAERPVDERTHNFDFNVASQRATRGDFATLPEVQVAHPKLSLSEQQGILSASLEARTKQEQDFGFASNAATAMKGRNDIEQILKTPYPSEVGMHLPFSGKPGWFSTSAEEATPGLTPNADFIKRHPDVSPLLQEYQAHGRYLDAIQKKRPDLFTPNPNTGEMEPTMQRPRWMTPQQGIQTNPIKEQARAQLRQLATQGKISMDDFANQMRALE